MQDSGKSTVKAMKAIAAQVKAIAEEFQVAESVALRILEDACGGAGAVSEWALSANGEAQGTGCKCQDSGECGHKCGEGACKAKEEAHAPAPVRKPAAPEGAFEATDEIWVGAGDRLTIPLHIIELAEGINGTLKSKRHKFGALTVIKGEGKATVLFGDKSAEHEGARVVHLNCNGQAQLCVSPAFADGDAVKCSLLKDGAIALTLLGE